MKTIFTILIVAGFYFSANAQSHDLKISSSIPSSQKQQAQNPSPSMMPPANDACASATSLTVGGSSLCGQTTSGASLQTGECFTNYAGSTEVSTWYSFTASNDSTVLNFMQTNTTNLSPQLTVYGPFTSVAAGCVPSCTNDIYDAIQNGDPGHHILLTGLTSGSVYLVQVTGNEGGGPDAASPTFCLSAANPAANSVSSGATGMNACGSAFSGSTNGGYWQNGTSTGFNNLDNNNTSTCSGCTAGDDTPFIINNVSWFTFCSATAGTWQITVNGVSSCTNSSPNQGVQASVFTGTTSSLSNQGNSTNPISPGGSWTSSTLTVNSGSCAYLMIDGFAGDACNYSVTLTNITGGCIILPIVIGTFEGETVNGSRIHLQWTTLSERENKSFLLEKSIDGIEFETLAEVDGAGNSNSLKNYDVTDYTPETGVNYYRLSGIDFSGMKTIYKILMVKSDVVANEFKILPNPSDGSGMISMPANRKGSTQVSVSDMSGLKLSSFNAEVEKGENLIKFDYSNLQAGIYILEVNRDGKIFRHRLVIN